MTKLLVITSEFLPQPGGIGVHAHHVARSFSEHRYDVTVLTDQRSKSGEVESVFDSKQSYAIHRIKRRSFLPITYIARIIAAFTLVGQHDTLLVSGKFSLWIGGLLSIFTKKNITAVVHGSELVMPNSLKKRYTKWCLQQFATVIAVSKYTKSLISDWGVDAVVVIPNGYFINAPTGPNTKRSDRLRLITVGNVTQRKGQHNVVNALPKLVKKFPNLTYDIVGIPTEKEAVQKLAAQLNVTDTLVFHGNVSDEEKIRLLQQASIFVMLSQPTNTGDVEGFGIAILEANALGLPAIGSRNCGIEDAISQYKSGILVSYDNEAEILEACTRIMEQYDAYAKEAVAWSKRFTWPKVIQHYLKVMEV